MHIVFSAEEIAAAVRRTAGELRAHFGEEEPVLVLALLNGALWFAADLLRELPPNFCLETLRVSSYGSGTSSSGQLRFLSPLPEVRGQRVLLLDDVLDTGLTLALLSEQLRRAGARELRTCVAVDKLERRALPIRPDFAALRVERGFLLGYGMDWDGRYRNLPYIARMED